MSFTNGLIRQICVPVLRNALGDDERGNLLLRCVRAFIELDTLSSFEVQMESTIRAGKSAAKKFSTLARVRYQSNIYYIIITDVLVITGV
jgi:hypothetical protein